MKYLFQAQSEDYAQTMIEQWKYQAPYNIYDYEKEKEDLLNPRLWGESKFVALNRNGELVGELTIEFFDETLEGDTYIDARTVRANPNKEYDMWIGFGLRPDLTSKGLGADYIKACIDYAVFAFNYKGDFVRLAVCNKNERAIRVYQALGFKQFGSFEAEDDKILWMMKKL